MRSLLVLIFIPTYLFAAKVTYYPKTDLPAEFSYLIESIQLYPLEVSEREKLDKKIKDLDQMLSELTKEEVFFILKSEIYKGLLETSKLKNQDQYYNADILTPLNSIIEVRIDDYHKFAQWLLFAIYTDLRQNFDSPFYNTFVVKKKTGLPLKNTNVLMIQRKFDFTLPWYEEIISSTPEEFHEGLKDIMFHLLDILEVKIDDLLKFSRFGKFTIDPNKKDLTFFTTKSPEDAKKDKTEDAIMGFSIEEEPKTIVKKAWVPKNEPTGPDPDYTPPETLPKPVNDW